MISATPQMPTKICHATTSAGTCTGIVSVNANNVGTQADTVLADGTNLTKFFQVTGKYLTLLMKYVKGGETSIQLSVTVFGADAVPQASNSVTIASSGLATAGQVIQTISGSSYPLDEINQSATPGFWTSQVYTANRQCAIPVALGQSNRGGAVLSLGPILWPIPGRYMRISIVTVGGAVNGTTAVDLEAAFSD